MSTNNDMLSGSNKLSIFHPRKYILTKVRKELQKVFDRNITKTDGMLLDYGCGDMPYRNYLSPKVEKYIGADIEGNDKADILILSNGRTPLADNTADYVISTSVLEHVPDVALYLNESARVLKKEGLIMLTTHGIWMYHPHPTDFWRWTSMGLKKVFEDNGFEIVHFQGVGSRAAMGLLLFQDGLYFKLPVFVRNIFSMMMQPFICLFDKVSKKATTDKDAGFYIVVAKPK